MNRWICSTCGSLDGLCGGNREADARAEAYIAHALRPCVMGVR